MSGAGRKVLPLALAALVAGLLLAGPAAVWLQARDRVSGAGVRVDAVYLVCGARSQFRRLYAMAEYAAGFADREHGFPRLLVGNDAENSLWSRREQRNLTRAEWAVKHLETALNSDAGGPAVEIVPGMFRSTDREMEELAAFLRRQPAIVSVALVTCPFHARRTVGRLRWYAGPELDIRLAPVEARLVDRNPVLVAGELLKMVRDAAGLARTPGFSRKPLRPGAS